MNNTFLQNVPYSIMFKANDDGVTVDELKMFYESDIIAALTKLTEGNMLLNANGELIGHPLEMQLRQRFRDVCKHHGFPSNNVAEADMVRATLAAFQVLVAALTTQVAELKTESLEFMAKADDRAETLVKELVLVGSSLTATEDEVTALRKRVAQLAEAAEETIRRYPDAQGAMVFFLAASALSAAEPSAAAKEWATAIARMGAGDGLVERLQDAFNACRPMNGSNELDNAAAAISDAISHIAIARQWVPDALDALEKSNELMVELVEVLRTYTDYTKLSFYADNGDPVAAVLIKIKERIID